MEKETWKSEGLNIVYWIDDLLFGRSIDPRSIQNPWEMAVWIFFFSYGEILCLFSRKNSFSHDLYSCSFVLILLFSENGIVHGNVIFPFFSSLVWIKSFWNMGRKKKKKKKCEKFRCKWILLEFAWAAVKCRVLLYTG